MERVEELVGERGTVPRARRLGAWSLVGFHAAISIGLLDAVLALGADPSGVDGAARILPPLGLLVGLVAGAWTAAVVLTEVLRWPRDRSTPEALAAGAGIFVLFGLLWLTELNRVSVWRAEPARVLLGGPFVAAGGLFAFLEVRRRAARVESARLLRFAGMAPLVLLGALGAELVLSPKLGPSGSAARGLALVATLGATGAALWVSYRARPAVVPLGLGLAIAGLVAAQLLGAVGVRPARRPPAQPMSGPTRIVLISIDTLRQDALTCYDPSGAGTPAIDRLAADSQLFTNAYSPAPWTIPAFVSLMTGLPAEVHGVNENFSAIPARFSTLAEGLRAAGYRTAAIGDHPQLLKMGRGFDDFDFTPRVLPYHPRMTGTKLLWRAAEETNGTDELPGLVARWLDTHGEEPFFLWLHLLDPHAPYHPPPRLVPDHPLVEELGPHTEAIRMPSVRSGRQVRSPREREWMRQLYLAEVRWVDESVGRIADDLRARGLFDDTLIVLLSDHGEEFWEHGSLGHGHSLYEELVRVPLIVKLPGSVRTGRIDTPVSTAAVSTTLLELAGVPRSAQAGALPGLVPLLTGISPPSDDARVFLGGVEYFEERRGVVADGMKLIQGRHSQIEELYALADDPGERRSVLAERSDEAERLRSLLAEHLEQASSLEPGATASEMSPEVRDALRDLGYVD